jgi:hypothetical protein
MPEQPRLLRGAAGAGQFAATAHAPGTVQLGGPPTEYERERLAVNAVYTAGRGFGRNRHGNIDRITEAYDAAGAYVDSLDQPRNPIEADARGTFNSLREEFEAEQDDLDDRTLRDRKFQVARQANWVIEYRKDSYTKRIAASKEENHA